MTASRPRYAPRCIVIMRHSEREDHRDHSWGKTAQRPHDSPLSTGGIGWSRLAGRYVAQLLAEKIPPHLLFGGGGGVGDGSEGKPSSHGEALVRNLVSLSSPLIRTVQTACHFATGFETALLPQQPDDDLGAEEEEQQQQQKQEHKIEIRACEAMLEPAVWLSNDLRRAGFSASRPYDLDEPLRYDLLEKASPRFAVDNSFQLREVKVLKSAKTGWFVDSEPCETRFRAAARRLLCLDKEEGEGSAGVCQNDHTTVMLLGHGDSTVFMHNAVCVETLAEARGSNIATLYEGFRSPSSCPDYTGFCVFLRVPAPPGDPHPEVPFYINVVPPFADPPHLLQARVRGPRDDGLVAEELARYDQFVQRAVAWACQLTGTASASAAAAAASSAQKKKQEEQEEEFA